MLIRCLILVGICLIPLSSEHFLNQNSALLSSAAAKGINLDELEAPDTTFLHPAKPQPVFEDVFHPEFDSLFKSLQKTREFSGTVLLARQGEIIHTGAYGYANTRTGEELQTGSVFQLASVSKTFTAIAILLLQQDGLLDIDDYIRYHIPGFPYEDMTIRHLLNHRSGLQRYMGLMHTNWDKRYFMSYVDVLDYYMTHKPRLFFEPDEKFNYNNTNYVFLAALVEYLTAEPFEQFLQKRVFDPLGMEHTYLVNYQERRERENHTIGYIKKGRRYIDAEGDYLDGVFGDKGVHSTVMDLFRFDQALYNGSLLNQGLLSEALSSSFDDPKNHHYSLGWRMKPFFPDLVYHFGWWKGYRTCFIRDMQAETTVIILCNRDNQKEPLNFWNVYQFMNKWLNTPV